MHGPSLLNLSIKCDLLVYEGKGSGPRRPIIYSPLKEWMSRGFK